MLDITNANIEKIIVHKVGNKLQKEGVLMANSPLYFNAKMEELLISYFLKNFKSNEEYRFSSNAGIDKTPNEIFRYVSDLFDDSETIFDISIDVARHLYNQSTHPKVNGGDLFVVYFSGVNYDSKDVDAIGIFKSEIKDSFIKLEEKDHKFNIESMEGINISKIDKGCLVLDIDKNLGYLSYVLDNNKSASKYWKDQFLDVQRIYKNDDFTKQLISTCDQFVKKVLGEKVEDEVTKERVKRKMIESLGSNEVFEKERFVDDVFGILDDGDFNFQASLAFQELYANNFSKLGGLSDQIKYDVDLDIVQKSIKKFDEMINLDNRIEIKIKAESIQYKDEFIEKGTSNDGRHYYKVFFEEES